MDTKLISDEALSICRELMKKPRAARGRQNDRGAHLVPAGVLIVPIFIDPGVPGEVYCADLVEMKNDRFGARPTIIVAGEDEAPGGGTDNVKPLGGGPTGALGELLKGKLFPGVIGKLLGGPLGSVLGGVLKPKP